MKITVVGATGQIGSRVVSLLIADGHDVVAASLSSGANVLTGEGLVDALTGSAVVIDVVNSPSFEDGPVMDFFTASARNLVDAAKATGVGHYVALSIVGADGLPESGYMRAKVAQEKIIVGSACRTRSCARRSFRSSRRRSPTRSWSATRYACPMPGSS